jgi:hypothetical protein
MLWLGSLAWAQDSDLPALMRQNVFEVVVKSPTTDPLSYTETPVRDPNPSDTGWESIGTAFALAGGQFVTAAHVLGLDQDSLKTEFALKDASGSYHPLGSILAYSVWRDFAVFEVPGLQVPGLARLDKPELNQKVYTAGNALGAGLVLRDGLLTSTTSEEWKGAWSFLRFSAPASPGNSGGPLLDTQGRVLGIVLRKSENENLNYALPLSEVDTHPLATLDQQYYYNLPLVTRKEKVEIHSSWPLPQTSEQLRSLLTAAASQAEREASRRLRSSAVPDARISGDFRYTALPGFLKQQTGGPGSSMSLPIPRRNGWPPMVSSPG